MATLHILSHSPFTDGRFSSCLRLLGPGDGVLLTGEAVNALRDATLQRTQLEALPHQVSIFALEEDVAARGLEDIPSQVVQVDYPGFVELCARHDRVNSWL